MRLKVVPRDSLDDGWTEPTLPYRLRHALFAEDLQPGDTVLYRAEGKLTPAVIVESAGEGCWLARDARHVGLIYLGSESIASRLPRMDLLEEAA